MSALEITVREKRYRAAETAQPVLKDIRLTVAGGQFLCILGPSGCGKTTLLRIVSGLDRNFDGHISLPGAANGAAPRLAYVFQEPVLLPWRTVLQNLHLAMDDDQISRRLAERQLEAVGLADVINAYPGTLSLGMRRRASLARAFAVEPDLLLMDEPFVSLDEPTADGLRDLLTALLADKPATVLFVTHDSREAVRLGERIVVLSDKKPTAVQHDRTIALSARERRDEAAVDAERALIAGR